MPLTDMLARITGKLAYFDGSTDEFAAVWEDKQIKLSQGATVVWDQLYRGNPIVPQINNMLAQLGGTHSLLQQVPVSPKKVSVFTFLYSGRIARSTGSSDTFMVELDLVGGVVVVAPATYTELRGDPTQLANLNALWSALVGPGQPMVVK